MQNLSPNTGFIYPSNVPNPNIPQGFVQPSAPQGYIQTPMSPQMQGAAVPPIPPVPNQTVFVNGVPYNSADVQNYLQFPQGEAAPASNYNANSVDDIFSNGVLDWHKVAEESERLFISMGQPNTPHPINPLPEAVHHKMMPSPIRTEIARYFDIMRPILCRAKNNAVHRCLTETILKTSDEMLSAAIKLEKTSTKLSAIHKLDEIHEELRSKWYMLYQFGYLGWSKQGRSYNRKRGITGYTSINIELDIIGRLIGAKLNELLGRQKK